MAEKTQKKMEITDVDDIVLRLEETGCLLGILAEDKDELIETISKVENKKISAGFAVAYIGQRLSERMDALLDLSIVITTDQADDLRAFLDQEMQRRKKQQ